MNWKQLEKSWNHEDNLTFSCVFLLFRDHVFVVNLTTAVEKIIPQQVKHTGVTDAENMHDYYYNNNNNTAIKPLFFKELSQLPCFNFNNKPVNEMSF